MPSDRLPAGLPKGRARRAQRGRAVSAGLRSPFSIPAVPIPLYAGQFRHSSDAEPGSYVGGAALYWYPNPHIVASGTRPLVESPKAPDLTGTSGWEVVPSLVIPAVTSNVPVPPAEMFDDPFATDEPAQRFG